MNYCQVGKHAVIHLGIDLNKFKVVANPEKAQHINFTQISRLVAKKGHKWTMLAFKEFLKNNSKDSAFLNIIGSGPLQSSLKSLSAEIGISEKVKFYGHLDHDNIQEVLQKN